MSDKPGYRINRRDVKMTERVAMAAVGNSVIRAQKVHGTDTSLMFAERASGLSHPAAHARLRADELHRVRRNVLLC